jgi:hypothetical protein
MENKILKRGDAVRALQDIDTASGIVRRGAVHTVDVNVDGGLCIAIDGGLVELVRRDGTLTDVCIDVAKIRPSAALPRGRA